MAWHLVGIEVNDRTEDFGADLFLSRQVKGASKEEHVIAVDHFVPSWAAKGVSTFSIDLAVVEAVGSTSMQNLGQYVFAATRGQFDDQWIPVELEVLPIQLTMVLVAAEFDEKGTSSLTDLVDPSAFDGLSKSGSYRSELVLFCLAELHAFYRGMPRREYEAAMTSLPIDASLHSDIQGLPASQIIAACRQVLASSEMRLAAQKDSALSAWESRVNDLLRRLSNST